MAAWNYCAIAATYYSKRKDDMSDIHYSRIIAALPDQVYIASQQHPGEWDPFSRIPRGAAPKVGARVGSRVRIVAWHGLSMEVEYIQAQAPTRAAMKMVNGPRFLSAFAGTWRFLPHGQHATLAHFDYHLRAAPGFRWLAPLMRFYFAWETRRRLNALAAYCEQLAAPLKAA